MLLLGLDTARHSATLSGGSKGVLHGVRTYVLQNQHGQISDTHSVSLSSHLFLPSTLKYPRNQQPPRHPNPRYQQASITPGSGPSFRHGRTPNEPSSSRPRTRRPLSGSGCCRSSRASSRPSRRRTPSTAPSSWPRPWKRSRTSSSVSVDAATRTCRASRMSYRSWGRPSDGI